MGCAWSMGVRDADLAAEHFRGAMVLTRNAPVALEMDTVGGFRDGQEVDTTRHAGGRETGVRTGQGGSQGRQGGCIGAGALPEQEEAGGAAPRPRGGSVPPPPPFTAESPRETCLHRMAFGPCQAPLSQEDAGCPSSSAFWTTARNKDHLTLGLFGRVGFTLSLEIAAVGGAALAEGHPAGNCALTSGSCAHPRQLRPPSLRISLPRSQLWRLYESPGNSPEVCIPVGGTRWRSAAPEGVRWGEDGGAGGRA